MTLQELDDAKHWRDRAAEMRVVSSEMKGAEAQRICSNWRTITTSSPTEPRIARRATSRDLAREQKTG